MQIDIIYDYYLECNQNICTDTRKPVPNSIFFALKGSNFDGNQYALDALEKGCMYAVVDDPNIARQNKKCILTQNVLKTLQNLANYHRKKINIPLIGIAGSNGKTTTKELLNAVLSKKYKVLSTPGNLNNHIGVPLTLLQLKKEHQIAIIEMGANHPTEIAELCNIAMPNYAIITSIGKEHLEGFGNIETIKKTNGELYEYVLKNNGKIFLHLDNIHLISILEKFKKTLSDILNEKDHFVVYSDSSQTVLLEGYLDKNFIIGKYLDSPDDIHVQFKWIRNKKEFWEKTDGFKLKENIFDQISEVKTHLLAYHNFINALCAVCVADYFEVDTQDINQALAQYIPDKNRMQLLLTKTNVLILDAYNANPTSMLAALEFFRQKRIKNVNTSLSFDDDEKILVLGDMFELGEHSEKEHAEILKWIQKNFQKGKVYLVGKEFGKVISKSQINLKNIQHFISTEKLIEYFSNSESIQGKFILIKASRGMQLEKVAQFLMNQ